ncbi:hypothetical protein BDQ17DRAFT_1358847 [Cyathus striatus]|nr:hypothetical protein BDQ17DRAFT_1358847 [Cyathus striatus]
MTSTHPRASFFGLPNDVQLRILDFLPLIKDIMTALETCRRMHCLGSELAFCHMILRKVCVQDSIFIPSFPMSTMGVSKLKSAVTGPHRFLSALESKEPGSKLKVVTTKTLRLGPEFGRDRIKDIFLVPGGRFLLVVFMHKLALWDLSIISENPQPVASSTTRIQISDSSSHVVSTTIDGLGLRILFSTDGGDEEVHFQIFDIYPSSPTPEFKKIADFQFVYEEQLQYFLAGNLLAVQDDGALKLFDFVEDKSISIEYRARSDVFYPFISDSIFGTMNSDYLHIWQIPELHPGHDMSVQSLGAVKCNPEKGIDISSDCGADLRAGEVPEPMFIRPSSWYHNSWNGLPLTFELIYELKLYRRHYKRGTRIRINPNLTPNHKMSGTTQKLTIKKSAYEFFVRRNFELSTYRPCSSRFVSLTNKPLFTNYKEDDDNVSPDRDTSANGDASVDEDASGEEYTSGNEDESGDEYDEYVSGSYEEAPCYSPSRDGYNASEDESSCIGIFVSRAHLSKSHLNQGWYYYTLLDDSDELCDAKHSTLCPFSGRICVADNVSDILIYDYLQ